MEEEKMPTETTYTSARANLATLCNEVAATRDIVIIRRRGAEDVALVAATELRSLMETAHLLRSPRNAARLLRALRRAKRRTLKPSNVAKLRRDLGLETAR
jgi:antitoxin YefM